MVLDIILPIFAEIIKNPIKYYIVDPVKRHISYASNCERKVERLQDKAEKLKNKRVRVEQSVKAAKGNGEEIYDNVDKWLISANKVIEEADEELIRSEEQSKKRCFLGLCPSFKTPYQLSKKVEKKDSEIDKLLSESGLDSISFHPPLQQIVPPSVYSREDLHSRVSILNEIMDALRDPNVNMIGVYGMGGVGKTTLAKEVHRQAQVDKLFDVVVFVAVSQTPELSRIQSEIAEVLGLDLHEQGLLLRANRLCYRLKKEKKILIILDDVWKELELKDVGIPFGDDSKGCKIFLTSRRKDVCHRMGAKKDFPLNVLSEKEAWSFFEMIVAEAKDDKFHSIAIEITKRCAGLPLLILKVAMDLQKNKQLYAWKDTLKQLSQFDNQKLEDKVYSVLKSSYDNLADDEVKSFFLLCGQFGQSNIQIQYLLIYSKGLDLFKHIDTLEEVRNRVFRLIDNLKAESLLMDGDMDGFVKMHDVVRDTALSILSKEKHAFIQANYVELSKSPNKDCTRISLPCCNIPELPEGLECPKAELFMVSTEDRPLKIPNLFFEGIRKLKVLDFTMMSFRSLPPSLGFLTDLRTLCLHRCQLVDVAIIGELKQLEVLSFADSHIVELPRQIQGLTRLKLLDLSNCSKLKVIPANVLSKLYLLEELYMTNSFVQWGTEGINNRGNASLAELEDLSLLTTVEIQVPDVEMIPKRLFSNGLQRYRILIGQGPLGWEWWGKYETSRTLKLKLWTNIHLEHGIKVLLKETEDLWLDEEAKGMENVLPDLDREGFPHLKHLHLQNNSDIQYFINSMNFVPCAAFPILESLFLSKMSLKKICHGQLAEGSFSKLRILNVRTCHRLTYLFSLSTAKCLVQLEKMTVSWCHNMEFIVIGEKEDDKEVVEFTQLRSLKLEGLQNLRSFYNKHKLPVGTQTFEESLFNKMVSLPSLEDLKLTLITCKKLWDDQLSATSSNLRSLIVHECKNLKYLFATSLIKSLLQLSKLGIYDCHSIEEIILTEESAEDKEERMKLFPKLDTLELIRLRSINRFSSGYPIEFQSLRELQICGCKRLMTFVPSATGKIVGIEARQVNSETNYNSQIESLFNEMVSFSNLEVLGLGPIDNLKNIWHSQLADDSFCKLKSLTISHGRVLKNVFTVFIAKGLVQLEKLEIRDCGVKEIVAKAEGAKPTAPNFQFPQLTSLQLSNLQQITSFYPETHTSEWPKLKRLKLLDCPKLIKFGSKINGHREAYRDGQQPLFLVEKVSPNLEELTLGHEDLKLMQSGERVVECFSKLKVVKLQSLGNESRSFLIGFLKRLHHLDYLIVDGGSLEVLFSDEGLVETPVRVKNLVLSYLGKLKHIWKQDSQIKPLLQYLDTLEIKYCDILINTAPSFQNLRTLKVTSSCRELTHLVTSSVAKTMVQLTKMSLSCCYGMTEVVSNDGDHTEDEIIFSKLKFLYFFNLKELISFCSGNNSLSFPSLEEVSIISCFAMKTFSRGVLSTPKLQRIKLVREFKDYEQLWEGDLNAIVARVAENFA